MPDALVTFVIPVAPYHTEVVGKAVASVQAQTVPSAFVVSVDANRYGAGYARNAGLMNVATPFVAFLDADDWVEPNYVEECLSAWHGKYVYTDWKEGDVVKESPNCHFATGSNIITSVIPTKWVLAVGGFDESLPAHEDFDFYMKMHAAGFCGHRLAKPLFHYGSGGQRAATGHETPMGYAVRATIEKRYKGVVMACCGQGEQRPANDGDKQAGDVLVRITSAAPAGNQRRQGIATGRLYARSGHGTVLWMSPADQAYKADWYAIVSDEMPTRPTTQDFFDFVASFDTPQRTAPTPAVYETLQKWGFQGEQNTASRVQRLTALDDDKGEETSSPPAKRKSRRATHE